jgi:hypothetical protein
MAMSPLRRVRVRQGAVIGAAVGVALFFFFYMAAGLWYYIFFIPLTSGMGAAVQYVKDDSGEDGDDWD